MLTLVRRTVGSNTRRLLGTFTAVLIGVAFLCGTLVLSDTLRATFDDVFTSANAGTDVVVRGANKVGSNDFEQRSTLDAAILDDIRAVEGVAEAQPLVSGAVQILGADGEPIGGNGPPTLGGSWVDDDTLTPYELASGRAPEAPGEVAINRGAAEDGAIELGDTVMIRVPQPLEVEVVGLLTFDGSDSLGGTTYTAMHPDDAQQHLAADPTRVNEVLVRGESGTSPDDLAARIDAVVGDDAEVITGADLTDEQIAAIGDDFLDFFEIFLLVFAGVALLVATFSINNTFTVVLAQRSRESALLRAIGATRSQVLRSVGLEALLVGAVASLVGLAAGTGLAVGLLGFMRAAGFDLPAGPLVVEGSSLVTSALIGIAVTMVAALVPAIRASKVPPLAALRDVATERVEAGRARTIIAVLLAVPGIALVATGTLGDEGSALSRAGIGALLTVLAMVTAGPVVARTAAAALGTPVAAIRGRTGSLARRNAMRSPRRTAATASALMVGVGVVTLFIVFGASIKASIDDSVRGSFRGDFVIALSEFSGVGIAPEVADEIAAVDEVEAVTPLGTAVVRMGGEDELITVVDPTTVEPLLDLDVAQGSFEQVGDDGLAVSARTAEDNGWALGDTVEMSFADGDTASLEIGAIYEVEDMMGGIIVPEAVWAPHATQRTLDAVLIDVRDGADLVAVERTLDGIAESYGAPDVADRETFVGEIAGQVDQMLGLVYALLALSIVIALMGIGNTLSLAIHERTRELGLLRAVGLTRSQTRSMVRWESVIVAVFGTVGGIALGTFLGWGLVRALAVQEGFGSLAVPPGQLLVVVAIGALAGVAAGLRPARRAARLDVLDALAT